ncbi:uncharacterized protein LOC118408844 [Branchiostoma floridae]|uniref:Uncharacterized protein LOC118408844 n=1 Tax=Branchiostoma floridae TaxID=7739 RepID=A0A9J7HU42_BRAFL|nr:uncharacterized protein LOC118408844 [Branchiostoma floridae]
MVQCLTVFVDARQIFRMFMAITQDTKRKMATKDTPSQSPGQQKRHTYVNIKPDGHAYVNVEPKSKSNREPKGVLFYAVTDYSPMQMHRQGIPLKAGDVVEVYSFDQDWCFVVSYPKSCSKPIEGWVPRHILREMGTHCCVPTSPGKLYRNRKHL